MQVMIPWKRIKACFACPGNLLGIFLCLQFCGDSTPKELYLKKSDDGSFQEDLPAGTRSFSVGYDGQAMWMADVDGNGRADLLYSAADSKDYRVLLASQNFPYGDGVFQQDKLAGTIGGKISRSGDMQWIADVNGDARADLMYIRENTTTFYLLAGTSDGTFAPEQKAGSASATMTDRTWMADVTGDGRADAVYQKKDSAEYRVLVAREDGTLWTDVKGSDRAHDVGRRGKNGQWLADVTGDGKADLVYVGKDNKTIYVKPAVGDQGSFGADIEAGSTVYEISNTLVYLRDVSGDGRADIVYNKKDMAELRVLTARSNWANDSKFSLFQSDQLWGEREYGVAGGYLGQSIEDLDGDGRADLIYNKKDSTEYFVALSIGDSFKLNQYWGRRVEAVAADGRMAYLADVDGDGLADLVYNEKNNNDIRVLLSFRPAQRSTFIRHLDVWGEGYIADHHYSPLLVTGFQDSLNLNHKEQRVSNGPNAGSNVPRLVAVKSYEVAKFPVEDGSVRFMTCMGAGIKQSVAGAMLRALDKDRGYLLLFGYDKDDPNLENVRRVFVQDHGFKEDDVTGKVGYPFNTIGLTPVRAFHLYRVRTSELQIGKGGHVGGAALIGDWNNQDAGGTLEKDEL